MRPRGSARRKKKKETSEKEQEGKTQDKVTDGTSKQHGGERTKEMVSQGWVEDQAIDGLVVAA